MEIGTIINDYQIVEFYETESGAKRIRAKHSCGSTKTFVPSKFKKGLMVECQPCNSIEIIFPVGTIKKDWTVVGHNIFGEGRNRTKSIAAVHKCGAKRSFYRNDWEKMSRCCKKCEDFLNRRLDVQTLAVNYLFSTYSKTAKEDGKDFFLMKSDIETLIFSDCEYCGRSPHRPFRPLRRRATVDEIMVGGIDRVDSSIGYKLSNCVPCCWTCNRAKSTMAVEEWENMVRLWNRRLEEKYGG